MAVTGGMLRRSLRLFCTGPGGNKPPGADVERLRTWRQPWPELTESWRGVLAMLRGDQPEKSGRWALALAMARPERMAGDRRRELLRREQAPRADRLSALGPDLAAAHFLCYRGAAVQVNDDRGWLRLDKQTNSIPLPNKFTEGLYVTMIDCENMINEGLRYEGLEHFMLLEGLKSLSLKGHKHVDDWGVDRLVSLTHKTLEHLNLDGCNVTHRCLYALYKVENLKVLEFSMFQITDEFDAALSLFESSKPGLLIKLT